MNPDERFPVTAGIKIVALLLLIGGVLGVGVSAWLDLGLLGSSQLQATSVVITGVFILLFGWAAWTGFELWRGRRQALWMAKVLYALQVPVFTFPGFTYELHTGLAVRFMLFNGLNLNFNFHLGSTFSFYISPEIQSVALGVNVVAVAALIYLDRRSRELSKAPFVPPPPMPAG